MATIFSLRFVLPIIFTSFRVLGFKGLCPFRYSGVQGFPCQAVCVAAGGGSRKPSIQTICLPTLMGSFRFLVLCLNQPPKFYAHPVRYSCPVHYAIHPLSNYFSATQKAATYKPLNKQRQTLPLCQDYICNGFKIILCENENLFILYLYFTTHLFFCQGQIYYFAHFLFFLFNFFKIYKFIFSVKEF